MPSSKYGNLNGSWLHVLGPPKYRHNYYVVIVLVLEAMILAAAVQYSTIDTVSTLPPNTPLRGGWPDNADKI